MRCRSPPIECSGGLSLTPPLRITHTDTTALEDRRLQRRPSALQGDTATKGGFTTTSVRARASRGTTARVSWRLKLKITGLEIDCQRLEQRASHSQKTSTLTPPPQSARTTAGCTDAAGRRSTAPRAARRPPLSRRGTTAQGARRRQGPARQSARREGVSSAYVRRRPCRSGCVRF